MVQTGHDVGVAFALTISAGLATCIGAATVYSTKLASLASREMLAGALGLSSGVMLYVSFIEIFPESQEKFHDAGIREGLSHLYTTLCFFGGFIVIFILDRIVHALDPNHKENHDNPHLDSPRLTQKDPLSDEASVENNPIDTFAPLETPQKTSMIERQKLYRMGLMTAISIGLHNFPEGLATFVAALDDPSVGGALAVAIAIHNIPEGVAVAMPVYYATGSRHKAFGWALISALAEPFGAFLAWLAFGDDFSDTGFAILFGIVGGMMVCIPLKELLPTARKYDTTDRFVTNSCIVGMLIMAVSLVLFKL